MPRNTELEALLKYSDTYLDPENTLWKPDGGDRVHLSRIILPHGGFVEFSLPLSGVFIYFEKSNTRTARAFAERKTSGQSSKDYLETGFPFIMLPDPGANKTWGFGHSFTPNIVALELTGPCMLEDIVYNPAGNP